MRTTVMLMFNPGMTARTNAVLVNFQVMPFDHQITIRTRRKGFAIKIVMVVTLLLIADGRPDNNGSLIQDSPKCVQISIDLFAGFSQDIRKNQSSWQPHQAGESTSRQQFHSPSL
jgi:hypothetical protein